MVEIFGSLFILLIIVWMILMITLAVIEFTLGMRMLSIVRSLFEKDEK